MGRPREFDRDRAVQQAMELFWRQGYEASSVQELGSAMGLNPGSLYNTFKDKHTLFLEALRCYQEREFSAACILFDEVLTGQGTMSKTSARGAIERFFRLVAEQDSADPDHKGCLMVNTAAELADRDAVVRAQVVASRAAMEALFHRALLVAQQAGEIDHGRDAEALASFLVNSLFGLRLTAKVRPERAVLLAIVDVTMQALG